MSSLRNRFDPSSIVEDFVEGPNVEEIAPHKLLDSDQADPKKKADYNESHICLFLGLVLFRIFNAVVMRTYFSPDEFWQGPEVAHRIVFGYGYETWEWRAGLRGYLHPLVYAAPYKLLALCGSDSPLLVLACNLASWFMLFCITRTNSSCLETSLSTVALYFWNRQPLSAGGRRSTPHGTSWQIWSLSDRQVALWLAGITCVVRPTSAILWLYMGVWEMLQATDKWRFVFMEVLPIGPGRLVPRTSARGVGYGQTAALTAVTWGKGATLRWSTSKFFREASTATSLALGDSRDGKQDRRNAHVGAGIQNGGEVVAGADGVVVALLQQLLQHQHICALSPGPSPAPTRSQWSPTPRRCAASAHGEWSQGAGVSRHASTQSHASGPSTAISISPISHCMGIHSPLWRYLCPPRLHPVPEDRCQLLPGARESPTLSSQAGVGWAVQSQ
eukprot:jgi/Mesen1/4246/ME000022S03540